MKHLKTILVLIIWIGCSSCASTKYINTHVDLETDNPCVFESYTLEEKLSMTKAVRLETKTHAQYAIKRYMIE